MNSIGIWIVYDAIAVIIVAGTIISSFKKGFSEVIVSACGYLASCVVASLLSTMLSQTIYDFAVKDSLIDNMKNALKDYKIENEIQEYISDMTLGLDVSEKDIRKIIKASDEKNMGSKMYNMINAYSKGAVSSEEEIAEGFAKGINISMNEAFSGYVPESFIKTMESFTAEDKEDVFRLIKALTYEDITEKSEYIEENYIRPCAMELVKLFIFILILFIMMIVIKMLDNSFSFAERFSTMQGNTLLGGITGIVESFAFVYILCILIKIFMLLTDNISFFSEEVIQQTKLFRYFYNFDIFR